MNTTRREFVAGLAAMAAVPPAERPPLVIFSKHLQFADWGEAGRLAKELGFDGVDLTVRKGGHVLPERVAEDLPKAYEAVRKAGVTMPMITTDIVDAESAHAAAVLRTASSLGIRTYRWGGFRFDYAKSITAQLDALKLRVTSLAELNAQHNMRAIYHTHSGPTQVGASIWDIWLLVKDHDPRHVSINYDIGHATVEGGYGGWLNSAHLIGKHMGGVALKDFNWGRNPKGEWAPQWCPAGDGMVNFAKFFAILKQSGFTGPVQVHYEYKTLGGADTGAKTLTIPREQVLAAFRKDLEYYRSKM